ASWPEALSSRSDEHGPGAGTRARPAGGSLVRRAVRHLSRLPRARWPLRSRHAAKARLRGGADRGRRQAPGPGRPGRPADDAPDGRPVPRPGLAAPRRPRSARRPGRVRAGDRVTLVRGRLRGTRAARARAPTRRSRRVQVSASRLEFATTHATEFVDITQRIQEEVRRTGLRTGRVYLQSLHTTDRKSTRLNSSHVSISYAVFCL